MDLLICCLFDKTTNQHVALSIVNSKAEYIRSNVESAILAYKNLNDLQPKVIGTYNVESGVITPMCEEFPFSEYQMPATKAEALAPLGVDFAKEALEFEQWKKERADKLKENK